VKKRAGTHITNNRSHATPGMLGTDLPQHPVVLLAFDPQTQD